MASRDHILCELLNLLVKTGLEGAWLTHKQIDLIHEHVEQTIVNFTTDFRLFQTFIDYLKTIEEQQHQFFKRNSQRLYEYYEGQYKIDSAKRIVAVELEARLKGRLVPKVIAELVESGWREYLHLILLKEGSHSDSWKKGLLLIEELLNFLSSRKIRLDALRMNPDDMLNCIEVGLSSANTLQKKALFFQELTLLLKQKTFINQDQFIEWSLQQDSAELNLHTSSVNSLSAHDTSHLKKWLHRAMRLELNSCLDFIEDPEYRIAGHLLWKAEDQSRFVFVNRQGTKIADFMLQEFADSFDEVVSPQNLWRH